MSICISLRSVALILFASFGTVATAASENALVKPLVEVARNREPVIGHATQLSVAPQKLAAFAKRGGRRPNVLVFVTHGGETPSPASASASTST